MAKKKSSKKKEAPLRFDETLVLNQWMLSLFDVGSFEKLAEELRPLNREGLDENNVHRFHEAMKVLWQFEEFPGDILLGYDQNIVKHTQRLSERRSEQLQWKYFQYLTLLFTEIYLDRYFRDPDKLLNDLNEHVKKFNVDKSKKEQVPDFEPDDLNKLAFWNATGSGKTLLMHVNILQYQHYLELHGRTKELNRVILLTPNEGLSKQHLEEFHSAGLDAALFDKDAVGLFAGHDIEIIDVHKLREKMGEKTVAVDAFEGNNLVLVDEGHRGASGKEIGAWLKARNKLCETGFSFEYSATFGQAMKASSNKSLAQGYSKCILFDYSYKYFYKDGFGKDYRILNLADDSDEEKRILYLTACLVAFYQQRKLYGDHTNEFRPFLLENPLWVFVGGSVNAVRTQNKRKVSDVVDILLFLSEFVSNKSDTIKLLDRLISGKPGLLDSSNREIFATAFAYLSTLGASGAEAFDDIMKVVFNSSSTAKLHVEHLKGTDGEIALRFGDNEPFGLINVGDASKLCTLCETHTELVVTDKEFSGSLFEVINNPDSTVNVLIGSKKFTEGWNSWRVSTMGLMNIGKSEGSEIIQLFGRGVRLKGHQMTLKRSSALDVKSPQYIGFLETLNVFGIQAHYMRQFKEYLEDEGLPSNEDRIEFILPVVKNLNGKKLTSIRLKEGVDYKRQGSKPTLGDVPERLLKNPIAVNWYPKIQSQQSVGVIKTEDVAQKDECKLEERHLAFMDIDAIWFQLQHFKNERSWYNLNLPRESILALLRRKDWYRLLVPKEEMEFNRFDRVRRWEEIAVALLRKYVDRYYKFRKQEWEADHLEYHTLKEDDPNFVEQYRLMVEESQDAIITKLEELKAQIADGSFRKWEFGQLQAMWFGKHLYQPLLHFKSSLVSVSPVSLNDGERDFVLDLKKFCDNNPDFLGDRELYLLRNMSRGRGIGFFEAGNFYPDFIVWVLDKDGQYVTFVDPKGIRNLPSDDPKILFYKTIKELQMRLGDPNVTLNSFIISNTPYQEVKWWDGGLTKPQLTERHVYFQKEDNDSYIKRLLETATSDKQVAVEV